MYFLNYRQTHTHTHYWWLNNFINQEHLLWLYKCTRCRWKNTVSLLVSFFPPSILQNNVRIPTTQKTVHTFYCQARAALDLGEANLESVGHRNHKSARVNLCKLTVRTPAWWNCLSAHWKRWPPCPRREYDVPSWRKASASQATGETHH